MELVDKLIVQGTEIRVGSLEGEYQYLCISDMAKNFGEPRHILNNWLRTRNTLEFLTEWEKIYNLEFNEDQAVIFKYNAGTPTFSMSPTKWVNNTNAIGLWIKQGRGGAIYAHEDIALELGAYLNPRFKIYLISEFKRLKQQESDRSSKDWQLKRELTKIYYRVHTDTIQEYLIPPEVGKGQDGVIYASEADLLNKALFGKTAREWRDENPDKDGNMRDWATPAQLVMLSMLQSQNAFLVSKGVSPQDRLEMLNETAIKHMKSILAKPKSIEKLIRIEKKKELPASKETKKGKKD